MVHSVCPLKMKITQSPGGFCLGETAAHRRPCLRFSSIPSSAIRVVKGKSN